MNKLFNFKKVIFGFLIAFILFNARKCGVYADTISFNLIQSNDNSGIFNTTLSDSVPSTHYLGGTFNFNYNNNTYIINYYYRNNLEHYANSNVLVLEYNEKIYIYGIAYTFSSNISYSIDYFYTSGSSQFNEYLRFKTTAGGYSYINPTFNTQVISEISPFNQAQLDLNNYTYNVIKPDTKILLNGNVLYNNFSHPLHINSNPAEHESQRIFGEQFIPPLSPIPSNFSEIDLTNYQGVYFYPKNYNDIVIETIDDKNYYDFNFYYKGCVNYGYFPLNNPQNVTLLNNSLTCSLNEISYIDSYFPTYEYETLSFDYLYYSYLIYNTNTNSSQLGTGVGSVSPSLYGDTKVYYNSDLYNYYLVEDFSTMNNKNCFINYDNQQQCIDGVGVPSFNDTLNNSQNTSSDSKLDIFKYQDNNYIIQILTLPFNFIKSFSTTSCQPITLPIPFLSSNITINCLSSRFKEVLGAFGYTFITTIINGFLVYRITIRNIDTFTDVADPENDKLEAIDL